MSAIRVFALLALLVAAGGAAQPPVGHWSFDEGEGVVVKDASGNGRHATLLNDARGTSWVTGRSSGAIEFSGGDRNVRDQAGCMAISGLDEFDWSQGLTVELWVSFTEITRAASYEIVSNAESDRGKGFRLLLSWLRIGLISGEGGEGKTWGAYSDPSNVTPVVGEWYHIAATYDGAAFRAYIDGELAGESETSLPLTPGLGTVYLGAYRGGFAYGLNGIVDDLRIYEYARSHQQIVTDAKLGD